MWRQGGMWTSDAKWGAEVVLGRAGGSRPAWERLRARDLDVEAELAPVHVRDEGALLLGGAEEVRRELDVVAKVRFKLLELACRPQAWRVYTEARLGSSACGPQATAATISRMVCPYFSLRAGPMPLTRRSCSTLRGRTAAIVWRMLSCATM